MTPGSVYVDIYTNQDAVDPSVADWLDSFKQSTNAIKGYLIFHKGDDQTVYSKFAVTNVQNGSGLGGANWRIITVDYVDASDVFANGDQVIMTFAPAGDKGNTGLQGATGFQGFTGLQGSTGLLPYSVYRGSAALSNGVDSHTVNFTSIGTSSYVVLLTIANTTDAAPRILAHTVTAKTNSSFTFKTSQTTDTANYVVGYMIAVL
jgi:hypothetical protein